MYQRTLACVQMNILDVSRDTQLRALKLLKVALEVSGREIFLSFQLTDVLPFIFLGLVEGEKTGRGFLSSFPFQLALSARGPIHLNGLKSQQLKLLGNLVTQHGIRMLVN